MKFSNSYRRFPHQVADASVFINGKGTTCVLEGVKIICNRLNYTA